MHDDESLEHLVLEQIRYDAVNLKNRLKTRYAMGMFGYEKVREIEGNLVEVINRVDSKLEDDLA